jgi:hypothetical protein
VIEAPDHVKLDLLLYYPGSVALAFAVAVSFVRSTAFVCQTLFGQGWHTQFVKKKLQYKVSLAEISESTCSVLTSWTVHFRAKQAEPKAGKT